MELFKSRTRVAYTNAVGDKVYPVVVDIKKGIKSTEDIQFVSSDVNTGILSVAFISGNENFNVNGADVVCSVMRPDASTLDIPCTIVENNIVEVPLGINGTSQDGIYSFDFKVFKGGNKVVGTPIMNYSVSLSISNDNAVLEDDRLPVLTMLMTQVTELKDEVREAINQANTATEATREATANAIEATTTANETISKVTQDTANAIAEVNATSDTMVGNVNNAISNMDTTVNDKISEVDTAKNDMINDVSSTKANMVTEVTNAKDEMTATVTNKVNEVEGRFNALTASQQQSSEVIDARDGETSLKARLDRDIEKAKQVYVNIEGSNISTDSSVGYLKDIEILGNTIQNASNLADIRSVGDKVEGQELYEIPVLSCGKNLANPNNFEPSSYITSDGFGNYTIVKTGTGLFIPLLNNLNLKGSTYIIKVETLSGVYTGGNILFYGLDGIKFGEHTANGLNSTATITTTTGLNAIKLYGVNGNATFRIQISENNITAYEPYIEDKLTILSPVQLEKVGDVADRIIEKNGVCGIEKNVGELKLENLDKVSITTTDTTYRVYLGIGLNIKTPCNYGFGTSLCNMLPFVQGEYYTRDEEHYYLEDIGAVFLFIDKNKFDGTREGLNKYLEGKGYVIKYQLATPQFIPLAHDQQVKLRTFANKTNISFGCEIEGTIKAQVPKSLGATVNTHTEQISNLNKELDRVKKLEESTVSTVTTESDFTTVEATNGGYFEDVKLEGKTLVNLNKKEINAMVNSVNNTIENNDVTRSYVADVEIGKTYTIIKDVATDRFHIGFASQYTSGTPTTSIVGIDNKLTVAKVVATDVVLVAYVDNTSTSRKVLILEGDHTQNPPNGYIEGLKSVGDGVDEISIESVNKLGYRQNIAIAGASPYGIASNGVSYILEDIEIGNLVVNNFKNSERMIVATYDSLETNTPAIERFDLPRTIGKQVVKINQKAKFALLYLSPTYNETTKGYIYQKQDKKRLLYYNEETQSWEKPILREGDSIEKRANGKYYYHQRSGEVVLNGSEGWTISTPLEKTNTIFAYTNVPKNILNQYLLCDRFAYEKALDGYDVEGVRINNGVQIRISKSKLSTQDVAGFKQWLQANNVTVVYQLAQEKVYECTNIDLITYANETNYIIQSGAIAPKSILKVHNNISNVVKVLQEKVSLLENKFIEGLKQVLAGDMYSLAELLYPEDFEEVETENNIMLLPLE